MRQPRQVNPAEAGMRALRLAFLGILLALTLAPVASFVASALASISGSDAGAGGSFFNLLLKAAASVDTADAIRFTLVQALFSTLAALAIGLPGAYLVANYRFRGRRFFLALSAVPFCLPPILVVLAFILYYGNSGIAARFLAWTGLPIRNPAGFLYTIRGLVLVHAFYNFPIIVQNVGTFWARLPPDRDQAARVLGAGRIRAFATGTLPYLLPSILHSATLVFLFCFFSFTIVLVFGGLMGSTLEVGIYRAIRFQHDYPTALVLAGMQAFIALIAVWLFGLFEPGPGVSGYGDSDGTRMRPPSPAAKPVILAYEALVLLLFIGPLIALGVEAFSVRASLAGAVTLGLGNFARLARGVGSPLPRAFANSLWIGAVAALLSTGAGAMAAAALRSTRGPDGLTRPPKTGRWILLLPLTISSVLMATGWSFLARIPSGFLIAVGQAAIAWPFVARSLLSAFDSLDRTKAEAARTLGARGGSAFFKVELASILPSIANASAFAFSMSMGDATIPIALGGGRVETLPLLVYRLASSYRFSEACAAGLLLALATGAIFFLKDKPDVVS